MRTWLCDFGGREAPGSAVCPRGTQEAGGDGSSLSSRQGERDVPARRQSGCESGPLTSALCSVQASGDWTVPHPGEGIPLTQCTRHTRATDTPRVTLSRVSGAPGPMPMTTWLPSPPPLPGRSPRADRRVAHRLLGSAHTRGSDCDPDSPRDSQPRALRLPTSVDLRGRCRPERRPPRTQPRAVFPSAHAS